MQENVYSYHILGGKKNFFYFNKSCKMCNIHLNAEHGNKIEKMLVDYTCTSYAYQSLAP